MPKLKSDTEKKVVTVRMDKKLVHGLEALATKAVYGSNVSEILNRLAGDLVRKELEGPLLTAADLEDRRGGKG